VAVEHRGKPRDQVCKPDAHAETAGSQDFPKLQIEPTLENSGKKGKKGSIKKKKRRQESTGVLGKELGRRHPQRTETRATKHKNNPKALPKMRQT